MSQDVFAKAADIVRNAHQPNDLVVVLPYSQMTPRLLLPGYELIELREVDNDRFKDYQRVWLFDVGAIGRSQQNVDAAVSAGEASVMMDEGHLRLIRIDVHEPRDPPLRRAWRR